jgi:hypothetical protein
MCNVIMYFLNVLALKISICIKDTPTAYLTAVSLLSFARGILPQINTNNFLSTSMNLS